ncbi:PREDICTED: bifunctional epoxide hydrolase 2 [Gekko japonicus]|uniref:Bifunctional epoxide hydrolase 2 n=1 Tax=Gekko japonicus TaxID=146911 RepID=A0ABM1KQY4_GEKJA|nr:PREDICTED: bifunctional epoxide hydrolase 2 [Gekko japonicus]
MAAKRCFVVFDLGGVLFGSGVQGAFRRLEGSLGLPGRFFQDVFLQGGQDGPFSRAMLGQIGLTQLMGELDEDCKKVAAASGLSLPDKFSVAQGFEAMTNEELLDSPLLRAALTLQNNGFKIAVLTNNWIDDSPQRHRTALVLCLLRKYFDAVIESCRIGLQKPDPKIYEYTLEVLKAKAQEVILLDDIGANLKPAREMGMATILVRDADSALKELQDLTGIQHLGQESLPPPCDPENVTHGYVTIKPGTQLHFVELGNGPPVCLCHGFPESWFSWRHQIPALADAGFRVLALEMKGYGVSTAPPDIEEYSQQEICKDLVVFLDKLGISQTVFIGHDWGGASVWNMALFYPERVRAVASLNTPFKPADPKVDVMELIRSMPVFDYQLYFQEPGVAEAELEKNLRRTFTVMIRTTKKEDQLPGVSLSVSNVRERGGLLVGLPEDPPPSSLLPEPVLQYYIQQYQKSGFRGPLNWYRNMQANWTWNASAQGRKIRVPALMVTAGKDKVLHPNMSKRMEEWIPQLTRGHIEECGHFTQMERPAALNKILIEWLRDVHKNASLQTAAKL